MRNLLPYDSFLNQTLRKIADCFCLSLLWVLCCIPVITAGAASTALYYTVNKAVRNERSGIWRAYWHGFRSNFRQATIVWILLLLVYSLLVASCYSAWLLYAAGRIPKAAMILLLVLAALVIMWSLYLFPHIARFQNSIKQLMKNCELMALMNFFWSVVLLALMAVTALATIWVPMSLVFVPGLYTWASTFVLERVFRKYMSDEDREAEDLLNKTTLEDR